MKNLTKPALMLLGAITLAACSSPEAFETEPVQVQTSQGIVTCQLYTPGLLDWDRSISRPNSMSVEAADQVCKAEGAARKDA
ncbi:hypothetical protein [Primorskyibacter sedentarius]|uniref:Uncharacterized protein n=1 Tax=Primorskyibacter sedentarius TaxID=745311 RepID=A0A4R3JKW8_9RHOB|nr:hypothetical protein [Primorskyibacter sedentarius]TCS66977.1 hypothetical protein EDD52_10166 [Primorskyibacter sedentarius]